jgi:AraC-like DNA-binding protein
MSGKEGVGNVVVPHLTQLGGNLADPHHELMRRIRTRIDANLHSADLTPARIAAEHFISTRHLHGLFQEQGNTVAGWIRTRRLEHCRRGLLDPVHAGRPAAAVAARWGFVDAAHFSRVFKSPFGRAPSEVRRELTVRDGLSSARA